MKAWEEEITRKVGAYGFSLRGSFFFEEGESLYEEGWRSGLLVGNLGGSFWGKFKEGRKPYVRDSLDEWTKRVLDCVGESIGAGGVYPFEGPPYYPFLSWAQRGERLRPGPLGLLVHPRYGLWHAYRGLFLWREVKDFSEVTESVHPCDECVEKPCLSGCPVGAFRATGLDVGMCRSYLESGKGEECINMACQARRKCVIGREYSFDREESRYHTLIFMGRECFVEEA
jgi:hypothetical protein